MGAPWRRIFVVAALTRKKNYLAFARHLPPINRFCAERNTPKNTLACAQTALGFGRCAHLSAPCARDSTLHLHRHRANLGIHTQMGTSHPTPRGQTLRCLGLVGSPGIERTRNSAAHWEQLCEATSSASLSFLFFVEARSETHSSVVWKFAAILVTRR